MDYRSSLKALGAGILGFMLAWSGWHLYIDHQNFHALLNAIQQQQQMQQLQQAQHPEK